MHDGFDDRHDRTCPAGLPHVAAGECACGAAREIALRARLSAAGPPLPGHPVVVIHVEDPSGSRLAACSGAPLTHVPADVWPTVPRWLCTGCVYAAERADYRVRTSAHDGIRQ